MALSKESIQPQRWHLFEFYQSYGANGKISDSFCPGKVWTLQEIRVHLSVAFASAEYLIMKLSCGLGSAFNLKFYSTNLSGSTDVFIHYSDPLFFNSDDHLNFELSFVSATNVLGFQFIGWEARG
jgi:hypothetical protein